MDIAIIFCTVDTTTTNNAFKQSPFVRKIRPLCYQENEITIEYTLTACVYNNQSGVYKCDDLNEETAVLKSNDPTTPSGLSHRLH